MPKQKRTHSLGDIAKAVESEIIDRMMTKSQLSPNQIVEFEVGKAYKRRDGKVARIIATINASQPLVAVVASDTGVEHIVLYGVDGRYFLGIGTKSNHDLTLEEASRQTSSSTPADYVPRSELEKLRLAYKHLIEMAWEDRREDSSVEYVGKLAEAKCNDDFGSDYVPRAELEKARLDGYVEGKRHAIKLAEHIATCPRSRTEGKQHAKDVAEALKAQLAHLAKGSKV